MAGSSLAHLRIGKNIARHLEKKLEGSPCEAFPFDIRVKVPTAPPYRYPDVTVVYGELIMEDFQGLPSLVNPLLLVEVLSPTTEDYDKDGKFIAYQSIASFREYLLVAQDVPYVTRYVRQSDNQWLRSDFNRFRKRGRIEIIGRHSSAQRNLSGGAVCVAGGSC